MGNVPQSADRTPWLTVAQVLSYEDISRQEVYRRFVPGDPHFLVSKDRREVDGKPGTLINPRSMSPKAQERWRQAVLRDAMKPAPASIQGQLLPTTDIDRQIEALKLHRSERDVVLRRFRIVELLQNHDWKAEGFRSRSEYTRVLAKRNNTSVRSIQRWGLAWNQRNDLLDLVADRPGPPPGTGTILDPSMQAYLTGCWVFQKLNIQQCYNALLKYLEKKQSSVGCRVDHFYNIPSRETVRRFLRSRDPIDGSAREGADALKAACGYIDRTYRDAKALDRVDVDEWITDVMAYNPRKVASVGRYYLLTFLDERSIYPLVWSLVEQPNEEEEIDLLSRLIREFGVPGLLNSDRGRFRGRTFGGRFLSRDRGEMYKERDGILTNLGINRNQPEEHNPRGSRLERFHRELANFARTLPGWCGRDTKERRITDADARVAQHKQWIRNGQGESPLLSRDQLLEQINQFMAEFRQRLSEGTDMDGFAPEAVFQQNTPTGGFRRISDEELTFKTAEHFDVLIAPGGIIQLRDGKRYFDPQLILIQGERREVARARHNHEQISVLPVAKGEEVIIATRRTRVGVNDPDELAKQITLNKRIRKLAGVMVEPMEYEPGAQFDPAALKSEPPKASDVIHPSEFIAAQDARPPTADREISSMQYQMERKPKYRGFADLEE